MQRGLGVDVQRVHDPGRPAVGPQAGGDPALGVGQRVDVEHPGDALAALDLAEQHVLAVRGQRQRERRGDRRLAGAALAGHHVQPHAGPVAHPDNPTERSLALHRREEVAVAVLALRPAEHQPQAELLRLGLADLGAGQREGADLHDPAAAT